MTDARRDGSWAPPSKWAVILAGSLLGPAIGGVTVGAIELGPATYASIRDQPLEPGSWTWGLPLLLLLYAPVGLILGLLPSIVGSTLLALGASGYGRRATFVYAATVVGLFAGMVTGLAMASLSGPGVAASAMGRHAPSGIGHLSVGGAAAGLVVGLMVTASSATRPLLPRGTVAGVAAALALALCASWAPSWLAEYRRWSDPSRISGVADDFELTTHAYPATDEEGPFFRIVTRFDYRGTPMEIAPVVACNLQGGRSTHDGHMRTGGTVPQDYGVRTPDGGAVVMQVPSMCDREKGGVRSLPDRFLPFLMQFDDAKRLDDGLGYLSVDAYDGPHTRMTLPVTTVEPATAAEWTEFRQHGTPNVVTDRIWESMGDTADPPFPTYCRFSMRVALDKDGREGLQPSWKAIGSPTYWTPYSDTPNFIIRYINVPKSSPPLYSDSALHEARRMSEYAFTGDDAGGMRIYNQQMLGLPDYEGDNTFAGRSGPKTRVYPGAMYPTAKRPMYRDLPYKWGDMVEAIRKTASFDETQTWIKGGEWRGFARCSAMAFLNRAEDLKDYSPESAIRSAARQVALREVHGTVDGNEVRFPPRTEKDPNEPQNFIWSVIMERDDYVLYENDIQMINGGMN